MIDIPELSKKALSRLVQMDNVINGGYSNEQLIFPLKIQDGGKKEIVRISEQELRFLFIEEFKIKYPNLYYSIETPTTWKFSFGKTVETCIVDDNGQSASHDMCVFEKNVTNHYVRKMNIEFKYRNSGIEKSGKDILKLIAEEQDGAFIHLLKNTNSKTLSSVFTKLLKSFLGYQALWTNENKTIQVVILSLEQKKLIHCELRKSDLHKLAIYFSSSQVGDINKFENGNWTIVDLNKN
ncbi:hypothetical protein [Flavobacterium mesophilum]|uniref:hypothetical protein n=1 Tax=Flavobacterium mesophilum TaxID=3143495 RepID=UPI0031CFAACD